MRYPKIEEADGTVNKNGRRTMPLFGQYTGFVDKNGKKIFEGDIVSIYNSKAFLFAVEWNNQYVLKCTSNGVSDNILNVIESPEDVEVVGNIYDNSELIKEQ